MQNTNPLLCAKFEFCGQSILEAIQAFHTVRIVLYIECSGPVVSHDPTTWPEHPIYKTMCTVCKT